MSEYALSQLDKQARNELIILQRFFDNQLKSPPTLPLDATTKDLIAVKNMITQTLNTNNLSTEEAAVIQDAIEVFKYYAQYINKNALSSAEKEAWTKKHTTLMANLKKLRGYGDTFLEKMSIELAQIAVVCGVMTFYMLQFAFFSHGALMVSIIFGVAALLLLGLGFTILLMGKKTGLAAIFDGLNEYLIVQASDSQKSDTKSDVSLSIEQASDSQKSDTKSDVSLSIEQASDSQKSDTKSDVSFDSVTTVSYSDTGVSNLNLRKTLERMTYIDQDPDLTELDTELDTELGFVFVHKNNYPIQNKINYHQAAKAKSHEKRTLYEKITSHAYFLVFGDNPNKKRDDNKECVDNKNFKI